MSTPADTLKAAFNGRSIDLLEASMRESYLSTGGNIGWVALRRSESSNVHNIFPFRPYFFVAILEQVEKGFSTKFEAI